MKNPVCLTLFVCSLWQICQSESYGNVGESNKNIGGEKQDRKIRSFPSLASDEISQAPSSALSLGFDEGNPDVHGDIQRPCQAYDRFCIRKYFADHSRCRISTRSVPDPIVRYEEIIYFSSSNMTGSSVPARFTGLNTARISEFYINKVTDNLVIAITFNNASKTFPRAYFKYYLRGREPIVARDYGNIRYGLTTVTVIIPNLDDLRLDRSEIYTYGDSDLITFYLGPQIGASTDPEVVAMHANFYSNIPDAYLEELTSQGPFMVANFIQYNICDFGLRMA